MRIIDWKEMERFFEPEKQRAGLKEEIGM